MKTEADKKKNRDLFPFAAAKLDELREIFGADTKVVWAEENGREVGKKGPDGVPAVIERKVDK